jgi:hypothetical protein
MAITLSQFITGTVANASSLNIVFSSAVSSGNSLVVAQSYFNSVTFTSILDPVNNAAFVSRMLSTMVSDTNAHLLFHDKLNLSSGRAASTYRISVNYSAAANISLCASEWTGGPHAFGSTISANGTSSGAAAGNVTASSTPAVFISGGIHNTAAAIFASTATGDGTYMTTVDPGNANQVLNVVYDVLNSSLTKNIGHSLTVSTRWLAGSVVYTGLGSGGATAGVVNPWTMCTFGVQ